MKTGKIILLVTALWCQVSFAQKPPDLKISGFCGGSGSWGRSITDRINSFPLQTKHATTPTMKKNVDQVPPLVSARKNGSMISPILSSEMNTLNASITIPVVVHILNDDPSKITDKYVMDGIDELNKAFAHAAPYNTDPRGVNTGISFSLARTAPDGNLTNGINRIRTYYGSLDMDMDTSVIAGLGEWDPTNYCNIWLVQEIKGEVMPSYFSCGKWERLSFTGFAAPGAGVVVSSLSGPLVAHQMGHYLSLLHTYAAMDCANTDCSSDGDMVCDTPPERSRNPSPCNNPENSCFTDTLSGPFKKDVPDMITNFMDYEGPCQSAFTQGQADRMISFLNVFQGGSLQSSTRGMASCQGSVNARFDWDSNPFPIPGDHVTFNNTSVGSVQFEWSVNGVVMSTDRDFTFPIPATGNFQVKLIAYDTATNCKSSYLGNLLVDCGVVSRFSPDKRIVASSLMYVDEVTFSNTSHGGSAFTWYISDSTGNNLQAVSTDRDLKWNFRSPGSYKVKLEASNGTCPSTSESMSIAVMDPRPDPQIGFVQTNCYQNDSIRLIFSISNSGYDSLPKGSEISFYDRFPVTADAIRMGPSFVLPASIPGHCSGSFTHIIKSIRPGQDTVIFVVDEKGQVPELYETNNTFLNKDFSFKLKVSPSDTLVYVNSDLPLKVSSSPNETMRSVLWSPMDGLNCPTCPEPILKVPDSVHLKALAFTPWGCSDSIISVVNVFPKDFTVDALTIYCYEQDSLLISTKVCLGNGYTKLKKDILLEFSDDLPSSPNGHLIGTAKIDHETDFSDGCAMVSTVLPTPASGTIYAMVNRDLAEYEDVKTNNASFKDFQPFQLILDPDTYEVHAGDRLSILVKDIGDSSLSTLWSPWDGLQCKDCLSNVIMSNSDRQYTIIGTTRYHCLDTVYLNIRSSGISHFRIPNAFTPNGDGLNDFFYVIASKDVVSVDRFEIYGNWGDKVFDKINGRPNDYSSGWDGTFKGKLVPTGTYVYNITLSMTNGTKENHKGTVTVIR